MVWIVIALHSSKVAEGIREMALQMANPGPENYSCSWNGCWWDWNDAVKLLMQLMKLMTVMELCYQLTQVVQF